MNAVIGTIASKVWPLSVPNTRYHRYMGLSNNIDPSIDDFEALRYCSRDHIKERSACIFHIVFQKFSSV